MEDSTQHPLLLCPRETRNNPHSDYSVLASSFVADCDDIPPITGFRDFIREFARESIKLWYLAGPSFFTTLCQSLGAITQLFAGQLSTIALAAVSVENSVIADFAFGTTLGMASALETMCGQAYGAGQLDMLGIYMQTSWIILGTTALILSLIYVFAAPILYMIGQTQAISRAAGIFSIWMIPELFAYAVNFPMTKFLQAQSKVMVMAVISAAVLVLHIVFSWLLMFKFGLGLAGAAVVLNASWWIINVVLFFYIISGSCSRAWNGFSWKAFQNFWGFVRLSIGSAVMICLEMWYFTALILFAGYLKNAEVSVDALSICISILEWTNTVAEGMNAAISVRISNELAAAHPRTTKFSLIVAVISSFAIGVIVSIILIITRNHYPVFFSNDYQVQNLVKELTPLLAFCNIVNNIQSVLSGVAIGAGWQTIVAYVNIGCYYMLGVPSGLVLGYKFGLGVKGIWYGMISGTIAQTFILLLMIYKTNWDKEASIAEHRIRKWGGHIHSKEACSGKLTEN